MDCTWDGNKVCFFCGLGWFFAHIHDVKKRIAARLEDCVDETGGSKEETTMASVEGWKVPT